MGYKIKFFFLSLIYVRSPFLFLDIGGTEGLFAQKTLEITDEVLAAYKNQGVK